MPRVLVVDDERCLRLTLSAFLSDAGYEVVTAEDAEEALDVVVTGNIDVVLTDIILPRRSGIQLLSAVRERGLRIPVVIMTGEPSLDTAAAAVREKAFDYVSKPITKEAAVAVVSAAIKEKEREDEFERLREQEERQKGELERCVEERTRELCETEQRFRSIVQNTDAGYFFIAKDGIIGDVNAAWLRLYGFSAAEEIVGRHFDTIQRPDDVDKAREFVAEILGGNLRYLSGEFSRRRKDGTTGHHTYVAHPVVADGEVTGIEGFIIDSTARREAEAEAHESALNLAQVQRLTHVGSWLWSPPTDSVEVSDEMRRLWGLEGHRGRLGSEDILGAIHPDDAQRVRDVFEPAVTQGEPYDDEFRIVLPSGEERVIHGLAESVLGEDGDVLLVRGTGQDITESRRAREALHQARRGWEDIFQAIGSPAIILDPDHGVRQANRAMLAMLDRPLEEVCGKKCYELFHGADAPSDACPMEALTRSGKFETQEMEFEHLGRTFLVSCTPVLDDNGELAHVIHIATDITEHRKSERALARSEATLRSVFGAAPVGIGLVVNRILGWGNDRLAAMTGYAADEFPGMDARGFYLSDDEYQRVGEEKYAQIQDRGAGAVETRWQRKDGSVFDLLLSSSPIDPADLTVGVVFTVLDITEHKRAEEELRENEERFGRLFDNLNTGAVVYEVRDEGKHFIIKDINTAGLGHGELTKDEAVGKNMFDVFPGVTETGLVEIFRRVWERGEPERLERTHYQDGRLSKWLDNYVFRLPSGEIVALFDDVTATVNAEQERARLEIQLRQQQRLESIGTFAGGVAHEINNPINGIMGYSQLILDRFAEDETEREFAREIIHETERVADIIRNLLRFARHDREGHGPACISDIINSTLALVRTVLKHDRIRLDVDVPGDLPTVECRSQEIQQVLMNLLTNARDALNERYPHEDENKVMRVTASTVEEGEKRWLRTTVEDHGDGVPDDMRESLFDPFVTTKRPGRGTGLGLSVSYTIARQHDGELTFESAPGICTCFHLDLPLDSE